MHKSRRRLIWIGGAGAVVAVLIWLGVGPTTMPRVQGGNEVEVNYGYGRGPCLTTRDPATLLAISDFFNAEVGGWHPAWKTIEAPFTEIDVAIYRSGQQRPEVLGIADHDALVLRRGDLVKSVSPERMRGLFSILAAAADAGVTTDGGCPSRM